MATCPFCKLKSLIRSKSMSSGGTRCDCGAMFTPRLEAIHWSDDHIAARKLIAYLEGQA